MKQKIALNFCKGIILPKQSIQEEGAGYSLSFISEMMQYGYMPDAILTDALTDCSVDTITSLYNEIIPLLKEAVGANVNHKPFYPNFPKQVMDASDFTLFRHSMTHYLTSGKYQPNFKVNDRPSGFENVKFKMLSVVTEDDIDHVFTNILRSADSISASSKKVVEWFINSDRNLEMPETIPFKENVCLVAAAIIKNDMWDSNLVKDTTDILRIVTHLNGGDISLAENTKFKSLPRKLRRAFCNDLERVAKEEDFLRHKNKWVKLFHSLHVGDYSQKLYNTAKKLRENIKIETFNGKLEEAMQVADIPACLTMLKTRPGIFARKIVDLLNKDLNANATIIKAFAEVINQVPARNLTQLWGAVKVRDEVVTKRVVFPKGSLAKAYVLRNELARLTPATYKNLLKIINDSLHIRFALLDDLGSTYIDPALFECPLPTGMRSASEGLKEVARGTRMPFGNKDVLRFFMYWKGNDIDLSATFHDANFNTVSQVSYTNLRDTELKAYHSGDITNAPDGATEFIDIDINAAIKQKKGEKNVRYVAMNVLSYSGEPFSEIETCFAGWMTRDAVNSNEIFEPKTVQQKVDLNSNTKNTVTVVFDLYERKAIWADVTLPGHGTGEWKILSRGNNVENSRASIQDTVEAITSLDNKITLGELFTLHANARGTVVDNKEDADTVFSMDEGVTPFDVTTINAEFL